MWSEERDELLKRQWSIASASQIAAMIPGKTRNAIIGRANRLRLPAKQPSNGRNAWSDAEVALLHELWDEGRRPMQIVTAFALAGFTRTRGVISDKANRLGLPARRELRAAKTTHIPCKKQATYMEKPDPVAPLNIPFNDREPSQCRAITDATRYAQRVCGHPVDERGVYCEAHQKLFYVRSPSKHR